MIDYAHPAMMAEEAMKKLHWMAAENKYDLAIQAGVEALSEMRLAVTALKYMKEKQNALRQQA
jgi:hypothetical protein